MTVLSGLFGKVENLIGKAVTRKTKIYDASKNKLIISGITIDGITNLELSGIGVTKSEVGVSDQYYAYYGTWENQQISFDVLPTAQCIDILKLLYKRQRENKAWFKVILYDNGTLVGTYRGHILQIPSLNQNAQASDRQYVVGVIPFATEIITNTLTQTN